MADDEGEGMITLLLWINMFHMIMKFLLTLITMYSYYFATP